MRRTEFIRVILITILLAAGVVVPGWTKAADSVETGLDRLIAERFAPLAGKRVGFITNQTSRTRDGRFGPEILAHQRVFQLVALYAPEHGLTGRRAAGVPSDSMEWYDGVAVYSLYGSTRKPTAKMLHGVDALVFDIQDVGVRPYTFLSTMIVSMEAAAEHGIPYYVLDRPNPLGGTRIEGNLLDSTLESFVGQLPIPYIHGMTLGELATMAKAKGWFHDATQLELHVITMRGWHRRMTWPQTGLQWVAPSPNVPNFSNAVGLAMIGATGELGILSVGIGTDTPFLRLGSNILPDSALLHAVDAALPFDHEADTYTATTRLGTKTYDGVRIALGSSKQLASMLDTLPSLYAGQFSLLVALNRYSAFHTYLTNLPASTERMFDKVTGRHGTLPAILDGTILRDVPDWNQASDNFRVARRPYLLYK